jgi:CRP/FNR family transcriptional regulator
MQRTLPHQELVELVARQGGYLARLLGALSEEGRTRFHRQARMRVVPPGTVLAAEGEEPDELGFVVGGTLAMSKSLPDGRTQIVGLLVPTDLFGRIVDGPHRHRVESLSDARLLCMRRATFETLLSRELAAQRLVLVRALEELDHARDWAVLLSGSKVVSRVAAFLLLLAERRRSGPDRLAGRLQLRLELSRADLASYLGTRPETLSRAFHELADRGVIQILDPYAFQIDDLSALLEISGQEAAFLWD